MAKTPGATLYISNQGSSGRTRSSDLYSGRGSARHHSGICTFICGLGSRGAACWADTTEAETIGRKGFNTEDAEAGRERAQWRGGEVTGAAVSETTRMRMVVFILEMNRR